MKNKFLSLAIAVILLLSNMQVFAYNKTSVGKNIIANGNFEENVDGWQYKDSVLGWVKGGAKSTAGCAGITITGKNGGIYLKNDFLAGEVYDFSFYARLQKGSSSLSVIQGFEEGGEICIKKGMYIDDEWRKYSFRWTVSSKNSQSFGVEGPGELIFKIGSGNENISYYLDEISIIPVKAFPRNVEKESVATDIQKHWAEDYIDIVSRKGIMKNSGDNAFNPEGKISVNEFVSAVTSVYSLENSENMMSSNELTLQAAKDILLNLEKEHKIAVSEKIKIFSEKNDRAITRAEAARIAVAVLETKNRYFIYVDGEEGNDSNDGTETAPLKTVAAAFDKYKKLMEKTENDLYIYIKGGEYYLEEALKLNASQIKDNGYNLYIKSYGEEQARLSMGIHLPAFEIHDAGKQIYKSYVGMGIDSRQLFINGVRATRARSEGGLEGAVLDKTFGYTMEDTFLADYKRIDDLEFVYSELWTNPRCGVDSVKIENGALKVIMDQPGFSFAANKGSSSATLPIYYENAYELLDKEGEWYLNKSDGYLYYIPRVFEDINTIDAVLPIGEEMLILEGTAENPIKNIHFENICFENTTWMRPSTKAGHSDAQNNHLRDSIGGERADRLPDTAVMVNNAENVNFSYCTFRRLGITALQMIGGVRNCNVIGNHFYDISGTAVTLGEPYSGEEQIANPKDRKYYITNNKVNNNYIHSVAIEYKSAAAISAGFPKNTEMSHNQIGATPYSGFHVGYGWNDLKTSATYNFKISNNYFHDVLNSTLYDGAPIYVIGGTGGTTENPNLITGNYIENTRNAHAGIYPDEGSTYWKISENVVDFSDVESFGGKDGSSPMPVKWLQIWTASIHDNQVVNNWSTTSNMNNSGTNNSVEEAHVYPDANWPKEAQDVIDNSGLEPEYEKLYPVAVQYARLLKNEYVLKKGSTAKIAIKALGRKNQNYDLSGVPVYYKSLNSDIAEVDENGIITGKQNGEAKILCYVFTQEDMVITLEASVFVGESLNSVDTNMTTISIMEGFSAQLIAKGTTNKGREVEVEDVEYTFANPEIASIDKYGYVTGLSNGKTTLTAKYTMDGVNIVKEIPVSVISYGSSETDNIKGTDVGELLNKSSNWAGGTATPAGAGLQVATSGKAAYYSKQMYGSELLEFDMKINASGGWPSLVLGSSSLEKGTDGTCYLIGFKSDILELQRFNDGKRTMIFGDTTMSPIGGPGYPNGGKVFEYGKKYHITVGRIKEENGVRIILNIDGKNIFDFLDTSEGFIDSDGYFGVYANSGNIEFLPSGN